MDRLAAMRAFIRVAEAGSFTAAARQMGVGQPAVSKIVAQLEATLDARLLIRSTHQLRLTEDGLRFLQAARRAVEAAEEAEASVGGGRDNPAGRLRLAASIAFGRLQIVPRLKRFLARHPQVEIDLILADRFVDLIEEGVDLAVRIGTVAQSGLVARRLGAMARVTAATPGYWETHGRPHHPNDLAGHACLMFSGRERPDLWRYVGADGPLSVTVAGPLRVSASDAMREAVLEGLGVGLTPTWFWPNGELADGIVEPVLTDFEPPGDPIHAVFPEGRLISPKVRAMTTFLVEEFRTDAVFGGGL